MFNGKKIAAVTGLLGGLALTCIGGAQAHAAANPGACAQDGLGNIVCTQRLVGEIPAEGEAPALRRSVTCQPTQPLTLPAPGLLSNGQTRIGPHITCTDVTPQAPAAETGDDNVSALARLLGSPRA
ncbi:hypothetical protein ABZ078_37560 [Streptomyces sp. NPDC006385]|uniref:hypothetical protein n=1 Tax=Streptomyces sp. NPDC006385 TaxID=3156761 RepID=UPI0033B285E3